ncbi:hypothetical protein BH09VER1_BH09VER1_01490 [soil metagenome]
MANDASSNYFGAGNYIRQDMPGSPSQVEIVTAAEVMERIRALAPNERGEVLDFLLKLEADQNRPLENDTAFEEAARHVLTRHAELMRKLAP